MVRTDYQATVSVPDSSAMVMNFGDGLAARSCGLMERGVMEPVAARWWRACLPVRRYGAGTTFLLGQVKESHKRRGVTRVVRDSRHLH